MRAGTKKAKKSMMWPCAQIASFGLSCKPETLAIRGGNQSATFTMLNRGSQQGNTRSFVLENDHHSTGVWAPV